MSFENSAPTRREQPPAPSRQRLAEQLTLLSHAFHQLAEYSACLKDHFARLSRYPLAGYNVLPVDLTELGQEYRAKSQAVLREMRVAADRCDEVQRAERYQFTDDWPHDHPDLPSSDVERENGH